MGLATRNPDFLHANNKGADQSAHPRSLISTFVIRYLARITVKESDQPLQPPFKLRH